MQNAVRQKRNMKRGKNTVSEQKAEYGGVTGHLDDAILFSQCRLFALFVAFVFHVQQKKVINKY